MKSDTAGVETIDVPANRASGGSVWRAIGVVFSVLLVCAGTLMVVSMVSRRSETQHRVYHRTAHRIVFDVGTADLVLRRGEAGSVDVSRRLQWWWSKPRVDERWDGDELKVHAGCPSGVSRLHCGVTYTVRVPADVDVDVRTSTGDVSVADLLGPLRLATDTGDVTVTKSRGAVWVHTSAGDVELNQLTSATVEVDSETGDVSVRFVEAPSQVTTRTGTGDTEIRVPKGSRYRVTSDTDTGDVTDGIPQGPDADRAIDVRTDTGDIALRTG